KRFVLLVQGFLGRINSIRQPYRSLIGAFDPPSSGGRGRGWPHITDSLMKNFSTGAACPLPARSLVAAALAFCLAAPAVAASQCAFRPNAPDQHKVVKGDTLWDIAGAFLERPWCWPRVWGKIGRAHV